MRRRSLSRRYTLVIVGILLVYAVSVFATNVPWAENYLEEYFTQWLSEVEKGGEIARCNANPAGWHHRGLRESGMIALGPDGRPLVAGFEETHVDLSGLQPGFTTLTMPPMRRLVTALGTMVGAPPAAPQWTAVLDRGVDEPCRWILMYQHYWLGQEASGIAGPVLQRILAIAIVVIIAVRLTAWPLVRRLQNLVDSTRRIVSADFRGELKVAAKGDELDDLAEAFNQATGAARERLELLERRDEVTREVLANVAHDVRTPLAAVKISVGRLVSQAPESDVGPTALSELAHLDSLLNNLLTLVQLQGSAIPLVKSPMDLGDLVDRVVTRYRMIAKGRGVQVDSSVPDDPMIFSVDQVALQQALGNLVQNATEFAEAHVAVLLFEEEGFAVLEVRDDGPGVSEVEIPKLSQRFFRGEANAPRGRKGQGLGLAIAAEMARRHGGTLTLQTEEGGGTLARLTLPSQTPGL